MVYASAFVNSMKGGTTESSLPTLHHSNSSGYRLDEKYIAVTLYHKNYSIAVLYFRHRLNVIVQILDSPLSHLADNVSRL